MQSENFVLTLSGAVRGIDLESAVPRGAPCVDFTPQGVPPEAARGFAAYGPAGYVADPAYDVWSIGMMVLFLYRGRSHFSGDADAAIMAALASPGFSVDCSDVKDGAVKSLVTAYLNPDPVKRLAAFKRPSWYLRRGGLFGE